MLFCSVDPVEPVKNYFTTSLIGSRLRLYAVSTEEQIEIGVQPREYYLSINGFLITQILLI